MIKHWFRWTGKDWQSFDFIFAILQRALWVELDGYGGEIWAAEMEDKG